MIMEYSSGVKVMFYLQNVHFFIFRFDVHVTDTCGFYIYSRWFYWIFFFNLFGICKRYKLIFLLPSSNLVTVVFLKNWPKNSCALMREIQFGDNWSLTSTLTVTHTFLILWTLWGHCDIIINSNMTPCYRQFI